MINFWRASSWNRLVLAVLLLCAEACAASPELSAAEADAERASRSGAAAHPVPAGSASSSSGPGGAESTPTGTAASPRTGAIPVTGGQREEALVGLSDSRMLAWIVLVGGAAGLLLLALLAAVLLEVGPGSVARRLVGTWQTARQHPVLAAGAATVFIGLLVAAAYRLPVVPYPLTSELAGELAGLAAGARAIHYRIVCEGAGAGALAAYYANTADYGTPSTLDREYIVRAFGPMGLSAPGLLTAKQAFYVAYYGAALDTSRPDPMTPPLAAAAVRQYCASGDVPAQPNLHRLWVNGRRDLALITYGECGTLGALVRRLGSTWKIVRIQELLHCAGQR